MLKLNKRLTAGLLAFFLSAVILFSMAAVFEVGLFEHNMYDSYTKQALAWREGRTYLASADTDSLKYLELAIFDNKFYVSFPPVPTVIELGLTFLFGEKTPNHFMLFIYGIASAVALTVFFAKKHKLSVALLYGLLFSVGTNIIAIIAFGGVWHEAQMLSFLLCSLAVALMQAENKILNGLSLFCAALAVGCRPFTAIFIPILLWRLYCKNKGQKLVSFLPYLIAPALVAVALMWCNFVRFGSVLEFGHNYLPEFLREEDGQFNLSYLLPNLVQAIKLPIAIENGTVSFAFNKFSANIFYLVNPAILVFLVYLIRNCIKNRKALDYVFLACFVLFVAATCMHRTLGGYQFGARYFLDFIPYLALYVNEEKLKLNVPVAVLTVFGIALNFYGAGLVV